MGDGGKRGKFEQDQVLGEGVTDSILCVLGIEPMDPENNEGLFKKNRVVLFLRFFSLLRVFCHLISD